MFPRVNRMPETRADGTVLLDRIRSTKSRSHGDLLAHMCEYLREVRIDKKKRSRGVKDIQGYIHLHMYMYMYILVYML